MKKSIEMGAVVKAYRHFMPILSSLIMLFNFCKSRSHEILLVLILCAAILLRLQSFGDRHYYDNGDYNRDYLIAHHIVAYHEFPLVGPEGGFGSAGNSPAYFYFLALPLLIKDDIVFLGFFNVFLQMSALALVYFLGRTMFGKWTGFIAVALFATNENIIYQSNFVWQPHIMQPVLLLSFLLLALSYTRKSYVFLLSSIACFVFSSVLHQSVLALAPSYLIAAFLTLRVHQKQSLRHYAGAAACFFGIFILLYAPLLFYFSKNQTSIVSLSQSTSAFFSGNEESIMERLVSRTQLLSSIFFVHDAYAKLAKNDVPERIFLAHAFSGLFNNSNMTIFLSVMVSFLVATPVLFYLYGHREKQKKVMFLLLFGAIVQFLAITALVESNHFYVRYLTPLFGLSAIGIVELVYGLTPQRRLARVTVAFVMISLISFSSQNMSDRLRTAIHSITTDPIGFFSPHYTPPPFVMPLIREIATIQEQERRKDFTFFDMRSYRYEKPGYGLAAFWVPLERDLATRLVTVDDNNFRHFSPIGFPEYIFFDCEFAQDTHRECINPFLRENPNFRITKELTSEPPIFVAQRIF